MQIFKEKKGTFCFTDTSRLFSPKIQKTKNNKIVQIASKQTLVSQSKLKPTCPNPKIPNCYPQTTHIIQPAIKSSSINHSNKYKVKIFRLSSKYFTSNPTKAKTPTLIVVTFHKIKPTQTFNHNSSQPNFKIPK